MKVTIIIIVIILISYKILMVKLKNKVHELNDVNVDLKIPTYKPIIKAGQYQVRIIDLGLDKISVAKIISRYSNKEVSNVENNQIIVENVNIYTAEDLQSELQGVGCIVEIEEKKNN